ncbi:hypothetical protein TNCV_1207801 [Trichonephila clavipes]|nr:hypothetical protein TNCV_1207801 [Trichonephila clavipes]
MTLISTYDMPLWPPYYGTPGTPGDNPEKIQTNEFYYVAKACHAPSDSPGKLASYVEGKPRGAMSSQAEQLRQAAATGNLDQVRALLKTGAKVEPDLEGRTALHLASANGHVAIVKALIEGGAKINALDAAGYSPLHQAATEGHEEVVKLLLKNGCHVDTQDELVGRGDEPLTPSCVCPDNCDCSTQHGIGEAPEALKNHSDAQFLNNPPTTNENLKEQSQGVEYLCRWHPRFFHWN